MRGEISPEVFMRLDGGPSVSARGSERGEQSRCLAAILPSIKDRSSAFPGFLSGATSRVALDRRLFHHGLPPRNIALQEIAERLWRAADGLDGLRRQSGFEVRRFDRFR